MRTLFRSVRALSSFGRTLSRHTRTLSPDTRTLSRPARALSDHMRTDIWRKGAPIQSALLRTMGLVHPIFARLFHPHRSHHQGLHICGLWQCRMWVMPCSLWHLRLLSSGCRGRRLVFRLRIRTVCFHLWKAHRAEADDVPSSCFYRDRAFEG